MGYVYPESSRGRFGAIVTAFGNGRIREDQRWGEGDLFHCKLKFRGHSPLNVHSGRAKLAAKVPKIRSFSKIVVHNFYGVKIQFAKKIRGRKLQESRSNGVNTNFAIGVIGRSSERHENKSI